MPPSWPTPISSTIPVEKLTSKEFARNLASTIDGRATPSADLADFPILPAEGADTTHLSTLDADGNAVALTYTLEQGYGSKAVVPGAGFLLNNEMGDFNLIPGRTDVTGRIGTKPNLIAPGKRMLSSQTPTIVLRGRSRPSRHRLSGRPDDPQYGALGGAQRARIRPRTLGRGEGRSDAPRLVSRSAHARRSGMG